MCSDLNLSQVNVIIIILSIFLLFNKKVNFLNELFIIFDLRNPYIQDCDPQIEKRSFDPYTISIIKIFF